MRHSEGEDDEDNWTLEINLTIPTSRHTLQIMEKQFCNEIYQIRHPFDTFGPKEKISSVSHSMLQYIYN